MEFFSREICAVAQRTVGKHSNSGWALTHIVSCRNRIVIKGLILHLRHVCCTRSNTNFLFALMWANSFHPRISPHTVCTQALHSISLHCSLNWINLRWILDTGVAPSARQPLITTDYMNTRVFFFLLICELRWYRTQLIPLIQPSIQGFPSYNRIFM